MTVRPLDPAAGRLVIRGPITADEPAEREFGTRGGEVATTLTLPVRAGLYAIDGARPPHDLVGVSLLDEIESDARPRDRITVNARSISAGATDDAAPRHLWPWLVALAGVLLSAEWVLYLWQMRAA